MVKGKKIPQDIVDLESPQLVLASSENAWVTEEGFLKWISRVWKPYSHQFERSLLIMDQFRVHKMESILKELEDCRTDVIYIPTGLTYFCQPCDVYVNKPLKGKVKDLWQAFMLQQKDSTAGNFVLTNIL